MEFSRPEYWSGQPFPSPGIFPTQGSNPGLPHCKQILYWLSQLCILPQFFKKKKRTIHFSGKGMGPLPCPRLPAPSSQSPPSQPRLTLGTTPVLSGTRGSSGHPGGEAHAPHPSGVTSRRAEDKISLRNNTAKTLREWQGRTLWKRLDSGARATCTRPAGDQAWKTGRSPGAQGRVSGCGEPAGGSASRAGRPPGSPASGETPTAAAPARRTVGVSFPR